MLSWGILGVILGTRPQTSSSTSRASVEGKDKSGMLLVWWPVGAMSSSGISSPTVGPSLPACIKQGVEEGAPSAELSFLPQALKHPAFPARKWANNGQESIAKRTSLKTHTDADAAPA